jgi:carboxymethylenebutenolidase
LTKITAGGADAELFVPDGDGPFPLVVFYMDAGGLRPAMTAMAGRLVAEGYAVLQPNLYWRSGPFAPFDAGTVFSDPPERQRLMKLLHAVRPDEVVADTSAFLEALTADGRVRTERIGLVGYCMGGRMAFVVASALEDRVAAAACIHAGGLVSDAADSPHRSADRIRAELYLGVADQDGSCTPEHQRVLRESLDAARVRYEMELYEGARHGFAVPDFPVYSEEAAERHWEKVLALFDRTL